MFTIRFQSELLSEVLNFLVVAETLSLLETFLLPMLSPGKHQGYLQRISELFQSQILSTQHLMRQKTQEMLYQFHSPLLSVFTSYSEFFILKQFRYPLEVSLAPVVRYNLQMCTDIITAGLIPAHNRKYLLEQHPQKIRGGLRDLE